MLVKVLKITVTIFILVAIAMYAFLSPSNHLMVGRALMILGAALFLLGIVPNISKGHAINRPEIYGALILIAGWLITTNSLIWKIILMLAEQTGVDILY